MTRKQAKKDLIIHIIIAIVAGTIFSIMATSGDTSISFGERITMIILCTFAVGGLPYGWRWASHIITAVSFIGIVLKAFISILLGWVAFPITIIKDIVHSVNGETEEILTEDVTEQAIAKDDTATAQTE